MRLLLPIKLLIVTPLFSAILLLVSREAIAAPLTISQNITASSFRDGKPDERMCEVIYESGRVTSGKFNGEDVPVLLYTWAKGACIYYKTSKGVQKLFLFAGTGLNRKGVFTVNGKPAKMTGRYEEKPWNYEFIDSKGQKHQALVNE